MQMLKNASVNCSFPCKTNAFTICIVPYYQFDYFNDFTMKTVEFCTTIDTIVSFVNVIRQYKRIDVGRFIYRVITVV